ncbi:hypothetical protein EXU85_21925 [Spirosoma sp. KCTC 42546]|uniref:hypothetical protein n=1 Tax=Spirosoma sp. KCTC 42546 TaxID=2520506 RepID=UPI001158483D|nr:hypothetical protein [Spirosoma sp. KCTC 42546]QDK81128.1 hypothetical protein EXU85_21925 [Spirosoma sp. KCTC 42546]
MAKTTHPYAYIANPIRTIGLQRAIEYDIGKQPVEAVNETGFGTQLVELLVRQFDGILIYQSQDGMLVKLRVNRPAVA